MDNGEPMSTTILDHINTNKRNGCEQNNSQLLFVHNQSIILFKKAFFKGKLRRFFSFFTKKSHVLQSLTSKLSHASTYSISECGYQTVPLNRITGSENRCQDFDSGFSPRSVNTLNRWVKVSDLFLMDEIIPPVELIQIEESYFVRDGHHRISVAKALGKEYIDACVRFYVVKETDVEKLPEGISSIPTSGITPIHSTSENKGDL